MGTPEPHSLMSRLSVCCCSGALYRRALGLLVLCTLLLSISNLFFLRASRASITAADEAIAGSLDPNTATHFLQVPRMESRPTPNATEIKRNFDTFYDEYSRRRVASFGEGRIEEERRNWARYARIAKSAGRAPLPFRGRGRDTRGIVLTCGGRYFENCLGNLRLLLRVHHTRLPIEVWAEEKELSNEQEALLANLTDEYGSPRRRTFSEITEDYLAWFGEMHQGASNVGVKNFHMKLMAILGSDFTNVLYLDADNTPIRRPDYLFEAIEYKRTGAIFWPDMYSIPSWSPVWFVMGVPFRDTWAQESGQILVDKHRSWRGLMLAAALNQRQDFFYSVVNGDKDTFMFAWMALGEPFHLIEHPPVPVGTDWGSFCGNSFAQSDPKGRLIFLHGVGTKGPPHNKLPRKWEAAKFYNAEAAVPTYRWLGSCIDVEEKVAGKGELRVLPYTEVLGNLEDVFLELQTH